MQIAMIGLGKMGLNMARRLARGRHSLVLYDRSQEQAVEAAKEMRGAKAATSLEEVVGFLRPPRIVWLMIPAGKPVDDTIDQLETLLGRKDLVIEGGNSFYKDDIRH